MMSVLSFSLVWFKVRVLDGLLRRMNCCWINGAGRLE